MKKITLKKENLTIIKKKLKKAKKKLEIKIKKQKLLSNFKYEEFLNFKPKIKNIINIKITPNNVFCTLIKNKRTIVIVSAGKYKINISKKNLKFTYKIVLQKFLQRIQKYFNNNNFIKIIIAGPKLLRKAICKQMLFNFKKKNIILAIKTLKCFNGCRPKKKKRKKQKGIRVFKK